MPRPLKIKIFMDTSASAIEEQINAWLASQASASVVKTETVVGGVAEKSGTHPTLVVTVWYEPPASDQERAGFRVV